MIDGHHTNHIKAAKELAIKNGAKDKFPDTFDGYKKLSNFLDENGLTDIFRNMVVSQNRQKDNGIDRVLKFLSKISGKIDVSYINFDMLAIQATKFENEIFKNRNNYEINSETAVNIFNALGEELEQEADVVQNRM